MTLKTPVFLESRKLLRGIIMENNGNPATQKLIRRPKVEELTSLSASAIYSKIAGGTFPLPFRVGAKAVAWRESDVLAWIDNLKTTDVA